MARQNVPFLSFNRGLMSPKSLARVDLDRTRLSAEVFTNYLPKTQGALTIRPGTKWFGSSRSDTGAQWVEFVASTDDVALPELTHQKMRVWLGDDAHNLEILERPHISTAVSLSDTQGWSDASTGGGTGKLQFTGGGLLLNSQAIGSRARARKRVSVGVSDQNVEHSLAIQIGRGPVTLRIGSDTGGDNYIAETRLGTGYHNLSFTPATDFHITLQNDNNVDRVVTSLTIGDTGTVEVTTPWDASDLDSIRYDQSADVVYLDCDEVHPSKIERRGTGRSWSVVEYAPDNGPFVSAASSSARLAANFYFGNVTLKSDIPFFTSGHTGALIRIFHHGQRGQWRLGQFDAVTDPIKVTGVGDTGTPSTDSERRIQFEVLGTWAGSITIERSIEGPEIGFKPVPSTFPTGPFTDTGTFSKVIDDPDDNLVVWYRARMTAYSSGVAIINAAYDGGGVTGIARVTGFTSPISVSAEVISRFADTGPSDNWQESFWSPVRGFPTAVALHSGRISHAQGGSIFLSVSDDYENFDDSTEGDAGPISRTLGSGPVDRIHYLISLLRLLIGTAGAELALYSSSLDEPVTPSNSGARSFSTQGSANIRSVKMDNRAIFVQRSGQRVFMVGAGAQGNQFGDFEGLELTLLVPDLLKEGVVSIAIQRQPDTRIHCVLGDGRVAILTYEPQEEVVCWSIWETAGIVEKAMCLPGIGEDAVYYHIRRVINGVTKRYLEKWALEDECVGDTGLSWLADCAVSFTDTGRTSLITGADHLVGESVIVWGDDTGQSYPSKDYSPDVNGVQTVYAVDTGGDVTLSSGTVHHAVVGLPYKARWKSTKLAYAAQAGTALAQMKRTDKIAFVLYNTHNDGVRFGSDTGHLDPLPRVTDKGAAVDSRKIFPTFDQTAMPFPGLWDTDSRIVLQAKAPRPCTVLAAIPSVQTNEKI